MKAEIPTTIPASIVSAKVFLVKSTSSSDISCPTPELCRLRVSKVTFNYQNDCGPSCFQYKVKISNSARTVCWAALLLGN